MGLKKTLGVIPARFASTRLPGKPLIDLCGKTMIRRVYERASLAQQLDHVIVATDHKGIYSHVRDFGGNALLTSPDHATGTDRCAEVAEHFPDYSFLINIQGDEPLIDPTQIDNLAIRLRQISHPILTLILPISDSETLHNPHVVKALVRGDEAQYFSRTALPFLRGVAPEHWLQHATYYQHIGMYGFRRDTLIQLAQLPPSHWEQAESLEQLRWLEAGYRIGVAVTNMKTISVDTPADAAAVRKILSSA